MRGATSTSTKETTGGTTGSGERAFSERQYKLQPAIAMVGSDGASYNAVRLVTMPKEKI